MNPTKSVAKLKAGIDALQGKHVLVVGDVMLDEYIIGQVGRISPEAPVPVVDVTRVEDRLGGAANVLGNVLSLGARGTLVGVVGRDAHGEKIAETLGAMGSDDRGLVIDASRPSTVKTRVVAQHQQVVRYDREKRAPLSDAIARALLEKVERLLGEAKAIILSDYAKGVLGDAVATQIIARARQKGIPILADPKIKNLGSFKGATLITPNYKESIEAAAVYAGIVVESQEDLDRAAPTLIARLGCEHLVVTKGEEGMHLYSANGTHTHVPTAAREVFDVSGAGDTVIATLAAALAGGADLGTAVDLANHAAGVVVGKFGTATVTASELRSALS